MRCPLLERWIAWISFPVFKSMWQFSFTGFSFPPSPDLHTLEIILSSWKINYHREVHRKVLSCWPCWREDQRAGIFPHRLVGLVLRLCSCLQPPYCSVCILTSECPKEMHYFIARVVQSWCVGISAAARAAVGTDGSASCCWRSIFMSRCNRHVTLLPCVLPNWVGAQPGVTQLLGQRGR